MHQMNLFDLEEATPVSTTCSTPTPELKVVPKELPEHQEVLYRGEKAMLLHPYSEDGRTSAIRQGNSYIVVLTSAIEKI